MATVSEVEGAERGATVARPRRGRRWIRREIGRLDPERDAARICELAYVTRYPKQRFPYHLYYTLFFVRATAPPASSRAMDREGRGLIYKPGNQRANNTIADIFGWMHDGPDSESARASLARVKAVHDALAPRWGMPNHVLHYTLLCDTLSPDRFMEMVGGPRFTERERRAQVAFWRQVGEQLGIEGVPETWGEMVAQAAAYERSEHFVYSPQGRRAAKRFIEEFCERWFPPRLHWLGRMLVLSLVEDRTLDAHGFRPPPRPVVRLVRRATALGIHATYRFGADPEDGFNPGEMFRAVSPAPSAAAGCPVVGEGVA
jgi:hypothetical protein